MIVKVFVDKIFFSRQSEDLDTVGSRQEIDRYQIALPMQSLPILSLLTFLPSLIFELPISYPRSMVIILNTVPPQVIRNFMVGWETCKRSKSI